MRPVRLKRCDTEFQLGYCDAVPAMAAPGDRLLTWWKLTADELHEARGTRKLCFHFYRREGWPAEIVLAADRERWPSGANWELTEWDLSDDSLSRLIETGAIQLEFWAGRPLPVGGSVISRDSTSEHEELFAEISACTDPEGDDYRPQFAGVSNPELAA